MELLTNIIGVLLYILVGAGAIAGIAALGCVIFGLLFVAAWLSNVRL